MWYYEYPPTEIVKKFPYYLYSIGLHDLQPPIAKQEGDAHHQFFYCVHGDGQLILNGVKQYIPEGSAFFVPAGVRHEYYPLQDTWDVRWMVPAGAALDELIGFLGLATGGVYSLSHYQALDRILNRMHEELIHDPVMGNLYASAMVQEFLLEYARQTGHTPKQEQAVVKGAEDVYHKNMNKIAHYVQYHYMHPVALSELCALLEVTPQHLCRITQRCTGMRPIEYVNAVRIDAAKCLLKDTDHSIANIAEWCGFENQNYFWKMFKQKESMTPGEYRQNFSTFVK